MITLRRLTMVLALALVLTLAGGCGPADTGPTADQSSYNGIPVGLTDEGYVYMGSPEAPVTMQEFTDYLCPFCVRHVTDVEPALIEQYIRPGQVQLIFRDNPVASLHPTASQGHQASACVAEQGAALFWTMHDRLFAEAGTWGAQPDPTAYLADLAEEVGANRRTYQACIESGRAAEAVNATVAEATSYGYQGTPMFRLTAAGVEEAYTVEGAQALETFSTYIDALLAGEAPPQPETTEPESQLPYWASPEGLADDPTRPGYTVAGDAYKGAPGAPLTVVEFSDFQCPVCRSHTLEVQPALDERFVDSGEVMWVFKHMPLRIHPQAAIAAAAFECGGPGQFWTMHGLLFEQVEQWAVDEPEAALIALASDAGLNAEAFATCLDSRWAMEQVVSDLYDGQDVTYSTPLFVVLFDGAGQLINGSLPVDQFTSALEEMLAQTTAE